jgi:cytochrome oxidase Cu insertion factor (SCO1/SenC/PrrC family)
MLRAEPPRKVALPVMGRVPEYTLTNQLGRDVSSSSFDGKVRVVSFLFTYCRGYCPLIAHNFMSIERLLRISGLDDQVQLITFNVDPENTGPAEMSAFQKQYGWDPENPHWQYLTGPPETIRKIVTDGYHVYYRKVQEDDEETEITDTDAVPEPVVENRLADKAGVDYDIMHNDLIAIVDPQGRIRKIFGEADRVSDEQLMEVIQQLIQEKTP